jgi:hypothetical protein
MHSALYYGTIISSFQPVGSLTKPALIYRRVSGHTSDSRAVYIPGLVSSFVTFVDNHHVPGGERTTAA